MLTEVQKQHQDILSEFNQSVVLMHGIFKSSVFDQLDLNKDKNIFVLEGRPSLDAAKFSCKQLQDRKIKPTLIADNMAGFLFYKNLVKEVRLSYQSLEKDKALCHIGSLILAVLAKKHNIAVYLYPGEKINLLGKEDEIFYFNGERVAPENIKGYVPLVEWLPQKYISKIYPMLPHGG